MAFDPRSRIFTLLLALALSGCAFRTRLVERPVSTASLKDATKAELVSIVNNMSSRMQSFSANVNIDTSVSRQKVGKANQYEITDYPEISGYVLVRKPEMLRMKGLVPVVRSTLFDMVSNGKTFALSIPPQDKFIVGSNQVGKPSSKALENLRPQAVLDALLLKDIGAQDEIAVLQEGFETVPNPKTHKQEEQPDYELIISRKEGSDWYLSRKIIFDRVDLLPHRQLIYDQQGKVVTDATYENFTDFQGILFPALVTIDRPVENYSIQLSMVKLNVNQPLRDDQFVLNQPAGSKLTDLDQKTPNTSALDAQPIGQVPSPQR